MPCANIETPSGPIEFNYNISTPSDANATSIDESLPTILLLHSCYFGSVSFHNQLNDPNVRKYNCIIFDARAHGKSWGDLPRNWSPAMAAEDAVLLLDALGIEKVHLYGVQMGSLTAMHVAILYPERCLSTHLLSPLSVRESEDVRLGKEEIAECWEQGLDDPQAQGDAAFGALQLAFSHNLGTLGHAMVKHEIPSAVKRSKETREQNMAGDFRVLTIDFFNDANRHLYSKEGFSRVKCPVKLTFCTGDIAYTLEQSEELLRLMQSAGVDASLSQVEGCHYGNVENPTGVNALLVDFIEEVDPATASLPIPKHVTSPYEAPLRAAGYEDDESDFTTSTHAVI